MAYDCEGGGTQSTRRGGSVWESILPRLGERRDQRLAALFAIPTTISPAGVPETGSVR
jgi:hypothetical protein